MLLLVGACSLALVSCGGASKSVSMREVEVYGDIGEEDAEDYLRVKGQTYKFAIQDDKLVLALPVETLQEMPAVKLGDPDEFYVQVYDKEGKTIKMKNGDPLYMEPANPEIVRELSLSKAGKSCTVKFEYPLLGETGILEQIESFDFNIDLLPTTGNAEEEYSETGDSEDWDAILDSYESYIDQYIALYRKAMAGDMAAMTEYASFLEKATELSEKLSNAQGEMNSAQINRFVKLQGKLTSGLQQ